MTARLSSLIHQFCNFSYYSIRRGSRYAHANRIAHIDRASINQIAHGNGLGDTFARQHRVVDRAPTVFDYSVSGKSFTSRDEHDHACIQIFGGNRIRGPICCDNAR